MTTKTLTKRVANLTDLRGAAIDGKTLPFTPLELAHVYVKLDFKLEYENASSADKARDFLRSVARASSAAHDLSGLLGGMLLEVQGSMIHVGLPSQDGVAREFASNLHRIYRAVFDNSAGRVLGWRMATESGRTLVVAGSGIHGDESLVSLGTSANRPAKHIYDQLDRPEEKRALKRFHLAEQVSGSGGWRHLDLDQLKPTVEHDKAIAESARTTSPQLGFTRALSVQKRAAAPVPPAGAPASRPYTYFGWVMRCDLDGFTSRVEECFGSDQKLQELASNFYSIMAEAAAFAGRHPELLAQLPWAGDNFTVAAISDTREGYAEASTHRTVELPLNFEKDMAQVAVDSGFGGWAHSVAGGKVRGPSNGNVYIGSLTVGTRRFLVGVGEGFGRITQGFSDIGPDPSEIVLDQDDWRLLEDSYREAFEPAITAADKQSSLYMVAKAKTVLGVLARREAVGSPPMVTVAHGKKEPVSGRPYSA